LHLNGEQPQSSLLLKSEIRGGKAKGERESKSGMIPVVGKKAEAKESVSEKRVLWGQIRSKRIRIFSRFFDLCLSNVPISTLKQSFFHKNLI
jgi:hypothetical protein